MSILRRNNSPSGLRVDSNYLRSIESAVSNDFDELAKNLITGENKSYIVRGFEINMAGAIGSGASSLQLLVANSAFLHGSSNVSGTFYNIASGTPTEVLSSSTNSKVIGSFVSNTVNYVGIEFVRAVDNSTSGQAYIWNPSNKTEFSKTIPLAEILSYNIIITSSVWAANVLPIAKVTTNGTNNVSFLEDSRPMLLRLGTAGYNTPNPYYSYAWNNHTEGRVENPYSSDTVSPFRGGDKQILNLKEWMDAIMTSVKEIKGTTYWYGDNTGGSILKLRSDIANLMMTGKGNISHSLAVEGRIHWSEDINLNFIGSRVSYKISANPATNHITLADDECAYINLVRGVKIVPNLIFTNGSTTVSSVGAVSWTTDLASNDYVKISYNNDTFYYKIQTVDSASQVTLTSNFLETSTGILGAISEYAWGTYETAVIPSTNRHIHIDFRKDVPFNEDTYWLLLREDNAGSTARVYVKGGGIGELEQGETVQISDNTSLSVLEYMGSPSETISQPDYTNSLVTSACEQFIVTVPPASSVTSGQYFIAYSAKDQTKHYFWFNKDSLGLNPLVPNATPHEVAITTGNTNLQNAVILKAALDTSLDWNATDNLDGTITVILSQLGVATDANNVDVAGLSINVSIQGVGENNHYINDTENLTKSIKRLDEQLNTFITSVNDQSYEEDMDVVALSTNSYEITGPVAVSTLISLPINSITSIQEAYTVNSGLLNVYLNGQRLRKNVDYTEVGISGSTSTQIQNLEQYEIGDVVKFEIEANAFNSNSNSYTATNLGTATDANVFKQISGSEFQFRRITAGSNIVVTENANDIVITSSAGVASSAANIYSTSTLLTVLDDIALGDTAAADITITLPNAATYTGKIYYIKKISAANTLYIKSQFGQTLDGVDIDLVPHAVTLPMEAITITAVNSLWWIL